MQITESKLADLILESSETILQQWEHAVVSALPAAGAMPQAERRGQIAQLLDAIAGNLKSTSLILAGGETDAARLAELHAVSRLTAGFSVGQMVSEFQLLRAGIMRIYADRIDECSPAALEELIRLNAAIDHAAGAAITHYTLLESRARGLFLGMLGHDLRTPLGAISMGTHTLTQGVRLDQDGIKKIAACMSSCLQRANQIVGNVLDLTRISVGSGIPLARAEVDLDRICQQVIAELKLTHPDRSVLYESAGRLTGRFDRSRMAQVCCNLIDNALQHGVKSMPVKVAMFKEPGHYVLTVWNHCDPIPPAEMDRIFEPLRRYAVQAVLDNGPSNSLGLGLYISREIIRAHGGAIAVESTRSAGTTFTVRLPSNGKSLQ